MSWKIGIDLESDEMIGGCSKSAEQAWIEYELDLQRKRRQRINRMIEDAKTHHSDCQCDICTMGVDAWLFNNHPSEY